MNVVIYSEATVDPQKGGIERMSVVLADMLFRLGHQIFFICWKKTSDVELDYPLAYIPYEIWNEDNDNFLERFILDNGIDLLINQAAILPRDNPVSLLFRKNTVPIIHVFHNSLYGMFSTVSCLDKLSHHFPLLQDFISTNFIRKIIMHLFKIKYGRYFKELGKTDDYMVLLSDKYEREYVDFCKPKKLKNLYVIPNPITFSIDVNEYKKEKIILFCGRMGSQKRPLLALKIWEKLALKNPMWKMIMLGDGEYLEDIRSYASQHHVRNIEILGKQNPVPYYKKASILCMTSAYEGLPLVLLEAFNYGCVPILYNTFASASDIVTDGKDGVLINENSEDAFIAKLQVLMTNPLVTEQLRKGRLDKLTKYSPEVISQLWENLLKKIK